MTEPVDIDPRRDDTQEEHQRDRRDPSDEPRPGAWIMALPVGIVAAMVGFLPWWLSGARLPLQNLWAQSVDADEMPIVLLPFSQYAVILIFAMIVVGAAVAGIGGRVLRVRGWGVVLLFAGVLLVQVTATVQTALVVIDGLQERLESNIYVAALVAGTGLSILIGIVVTVLIARAPRAGALIGLTIGAIGAASWFGSLVAPLGSTAVPDALLFVFPWIAPVLTGVAIAWAGINTAGRVIAALVALALVWVAPALTTAVASSVGSRVLIRAGASDVIDYGMSVFRMALLTPELALRPILATVIVAAVGLLIRVLVGRRTRTGAPM